MPDWYAVLRASRYLGVPPWELLDREIVWMNWALAAEGAEVEAQEQRAKRERRKKGHR